MWFDNNKFIKSQNQKKKSFLKLKYALLFLFLIILHFINIIREEKLILLFL